MKVTIVSVCVCAAAIYLIPALKVPVQIPILLLCVAEAAMLIPEK